MLKAYRQKSLEYFQYTICGHGDPPDLSAFTEELQKALLCWDEVGDHIRETCSEGKSNCVLPSQQMSLLLTKRLSGTREILLQQMLDYVASVDSVDTICRDNQIPSLETYWQRRELTAAVYPVIGTIPYAYPSLFSLGIQS